MLQFINVQFKEQVNIDKQDVEFINCTFSVEGANQKDTKGTALFISNNVNAKLTNCTFKNKGYNCINIKTSGIVEIERCTFITENVYNPIECAGSVNAGINNITIENNIFNTTCGNNYISFFHMADEAMVDIKRNLFSNVNPSSNILRLSNPANTSAIFKIADNSYHYNSKEVNDYTAFLICQEYGATAQDFSKFTLDFSNLKCNNTVVVDQPVQGSLFYSYKDGVGVVTGQNDPIIKIG